MTAPFTDEQLAVIRERRPELQQVSGRQALLDLLAQPELAIPAMLELDADCHVVSQAVQTLGGKTSTAALAAMLDDPHERLGPALDELGAQGLLVIGAGGQIISPYEPGVWEHPFGLGRPMAELAQSSTLDDLKIIAKAHGAGTSARKAALTAQIETVLRDDPAAVVRAAAALSRQAAKLLKSLATTHPIAQPEQIWYGSAGKNGPVGQLAAAGLVVRTGWQYEMPREVALALRGTAWKPALTGQPGFATAPTPPADGVQAALSAVAKVAALAELAAREPITELKSGGVGVKELRRLAKALDVPDLEVPLWLDLAYEADFLAALQEGGLAATKALDAWLAEPLASRWARLAEVWQTLGHAPTHRIRGCCEEHMKPEPPPFTFECPAGPIRSATLRILRELEPGLGARAADELKAAVEWRTRAALEAPLAVSAFIAASLREGELLGLAAHGALTSAGRALLAGEPIDGLFPAPVRTATLQGDLTAIVAGTPAHELGALLAECADLESRDAAGVWRFSESSIRRALDAGVTAAALLGSLEQIASNGVPQALAYLIGDVGRKHGSIRVSAPACVVVAADHVLLAELVSAKKLRKLGLRQVAPTVALSALPPDQTLGLMRQAGFAPVAEAADGTLRAERPQRELVEVADDVSEPGWEIEVGEDAITRAALTGEPIVLTWKRGFRGEHYLEDLQIRRGRGTAYCHDCDAKHTFDIDDILSASLSG